MPLLHHRPEIEDIRLAYDSDKSSASDSQPSSQTSPSITDRSCPSQPAMYSDGSRRPAWVHYPTGDEELHFFPDRQPQESPRASTETYASTVQSEEDEEDLSQEPPEYELPEYTAHPYEPTAIPATPSDFSELFPSHRTLRIRHDDSTLDGNMNLRIDTEVAMHGGRRCDMTLFHLRMHDLRDREFSLRRYCRDSGREVCHITRKQHNAPSQKRPGFSRSLSNALNSMRPKSSDQKSPALNSLKRNDSGYDSAHSSSETAVDDPSHPAPATARPTQAIKPNSVRLEFSNYAQVDVKRTGGKASKRYEFEYWGVTYTWRRVVQKDDHSEDASYHLTKAGHDQALAYVIPSPLTTAQADEEHSKGGWVPPCSMWIADENMVRGQKDVADVVVAAGLITLVDDAIRARFHSKHSQQLFIPKFGVDYIGPKRLINEMFRRDGSGLHSRQPSTNGSSNSNNTSAVDMRAASAATRPASRG